MQNVGFCPPPLSSKTPQEEVVNRGVSIPSEGNGVSTGRQDKPSGKNLEVHQLSGVGR